MTSTRLWCAKTRVWVGFSVSLALKRGLGHSIKAFSKKKAIWEFQKKSHFQREAKCNNEFSSHDVQKVIFISIALHPRFETEA